MIFYVSNVENRLPLIKRYLSLIDTQARMALRADASRLFMGYIWWILEPLLYVAVFYVVFDVVLQRGRADFLLFLICGKLPFMWFSGSVSLAANSLHSAKGLIGQSRLPKVMFPLAKVQEGLYRQSAVFVLLLLVASIGGPGAGLYWFWLIPIALVQYLLIVACAIAAALLVCVARDFVRIISLGILFLLFVSGIFWDIRAVSPVEMQELLLAINPIAFILDAYRQVLMYQTAPDLNHLLMLGLGSLLACVFITLLTRRLDSWVAYRVLST
jgi:lipopolysaccharide transport system permease protein